MAEALRYVAPSSLIVGYDFSTGATKCLAFDLSGRTVAEARVPTELHTAGGVSELDLDHLRMQAHTTTRHLVDQLRAQGRLGDWSAAGISATHHTAGRIDAQGQQVRRAICWNDQTLAKYHGRGQTRLGGPKKVQELIGGPWASRYSLSHLVKDEETLTRADWERTAFIAPHGTLAAGYLTDRFDVTSISGAASTGLLDLRTNQWRQEMLGALADEQYRALAWQQLPALIDANTPVGPLSSTLATELGIAADGRPLVFPHSDDQAAGLIGGGAVEAGQVAVILGNSAVVNSSADHAPQAGNLDAMKLNSGPYLWMRCYNNGAQFLDRLLGPNPDWSALEAAATAEPAGCQGVAVLPFLLPEPSLGVPTMRLKWFPRQPLEPGVRFRAALEALATLIVFGVREHIAAGQTVRSLTISGGIAKSPLMGQILASMLNRPIQRLQSSEGPALGAAVTALAALETHRRRAAGDLTPYPVSAAVAQMVQFRAPVEPVAEWVPVYQRYLVGYEKALKG
jgi:sugar (pentulose or hexulose) kinase